MEEILASIRRIISEDDAPAAAAEPAHAHAHGDDVLELTQVAPEPARSAEPPRAAPASIPSLGELGDLDVSERAPPAPPKPAPALPPAAAAPPPPHADEPLVGAQAAQTAASAFGQLAQSTALPASGRTLEDLVREMLRPMLKDWLDQHLAEIVQARVQAEVERVSRGGRGY